MAAQDFDMIVIGAGPGGYVCAIRGAQLGLKVAVVEREHLGGICLNWGCIPTKALLRSAEVFHLMKRAKDFGLKADAVSFDFDAVVKRSRAVARQLAGGVGHLLKKNKVTVVMGEARLAGKGRVAVKGEKGEQELAAPAIVIATGARARELPGMEPDGDLIWTYRHALQPPRMPKDLLVIGSGAIGIEFASFFNALGAKVTVAEAVDRILPVEDAEISAFARKQFARQGMTLIEGAKVTLAKGKGHVTARIEAGGKTEEKVFDTVISAVGIVGNVEGIGLEEAGVRVERTHVVTDAYCRTGGRGAVGHRRCGGAALAGPQGEP
ncbi:Pyruvate/2-oxoglutarate dehydrogenase complex [Rubellimicrobium thermophilum DSM 16684]|uniref:Dihydrolipoamide dehydrogenase n=1 Tax=Rubellimicrobium thermophilum DSM 16684 TaxID=1123069 RepID=S9QSW0_9RHOB|nr:Pyruvate/2-oxoglutarate dehydrogenase complex [Rubellimicrobium thermophilum DSM 16684]